MSRNFYSPTDMISNKSPDFSRSCILFGGSFDPLHLGHLHIAAAALRLLPYTEQLFFVPCQESPGKNRPLLPAALRLAFLRTGLQYQPYGIWTHELEKTEPSYTIHTLEAAHRLGAEKKRLYWLLGGDAYESFPRWKNPEGIRALAQLVVCQRPGSPWPTLQHPDDIRLAVPPFAASSTQIRESLAKGVVPENTLPTALEGYFSALFEGTLKGANPYANFPPGGKND